MCIRDRYIIVGDLEREQYGSSGLAKFEELPVAFANDRVTTVSYTHLRAHETVLDLVCRLLLDKKNHNKQYTTQ